MVNRTAAGHVSIGRLLLVVFSLGLLVAGLTIWLMFLSYRMSVVQNVARADGQHIAQLVYEHLHSVMRKGVSRQEVDELLEHIQRRLPDYSVSVIRGEPVERQFGARPEQAGIEARDPDLHVVLAGGGERVLEADGVLRYLFPMRVVTECLACHSAAQAGEVNGVVDVGVPLARLEEPITRMAYPVMYVVLGVLALFFGLIYLILRSWVSRPIQILAHEVSAMTRAGDYVHHVQVGKVWPQEVKALAVNFSLLMRQVRQSHRKLEDLSLHDPLTGLYNRRHFDQVLAQAVRDAGRGESGGFALLLIDLDGFKPVNDTHGHAAGDALLVAVARALSGAMRESDVAARLGGDEFGVLAFVRQIDELSGLTERIRAAIEASYIRAGAVEVHAACSIGSAWQPTGMAGDPAALLALADAVMYSDKEARRAQRPARDCSESPAGQVEVAG